MSSLYAFILFTIIFIPCIFGQDITETSLTFVIDDTGSMSEEISQVKDSVNSIFDSVVSSPDSPIKNFVLVTFNDHQCSSCSEGPADAKLLTITNDRHEFKRALASISVDGGGDCPEYSMTGIQLALEHSLPRSLLYVFTDASARDYKMFEKVESFAKKKTIQVTFLLTGVCSSRTDADYQVYNKLAAATDGEVFNIFKNNVNEVLGYIKKNLKGITNTIISETFSPGYGHKVDIPVDGKTKGVILSVTGLDSNITVTNPEGKDAPLEHIVNLAEAKVVKLKENKTGIHRAELGSRSETKLKVTGISSVSFQHGFSSFIPTSLYDTATRPAAEGEAYLSIKLHGDGVTLETAKILDMDNNVIVELPLQLINEKTKFYVTKLFDPPRKTFRIAVYGYDDKDKSPIKRVSTLIERKKLELDIVTDVIPSVNIEGGPKMFAKYNEDLQLKCKVHGYPKPNITWLNKNTGSTLAATVTTIETSDYLSTLTLPKVNKNGTFECKAENSLGVSISSVEVELTVYFNVLVTPAEVISIKYGDEETIECKVEASPPATVTWYRDGKVLSNDHNFQITDDMMTLVIKHMDKSIEGDYMCEARNDLNRKIFKSNVFVHGLVKPVINKKEEKIHVIRGNDAKLTCEIIEAAPKPNIQWYFLKRGDEKYDELKEFEEVLHLKNITDDNMGTYVCQATNTMGSDRYAVDLVVAHPPTIKNDDVKIRRAKNGAIVTLPCEVDAIPKASVKWIKDGAILGSKRNIRMTTNHSLKFRKIAVSDTGYYSCVATNKFGSTNKTVYVDVFVPVTIEVPKISTIETMVGRNVVLTCQADGYPKPEIKWVFNGFEGKKLGRIIRTNSTTSLGLKLLQVTDQGFYTCVASNSGGSTNITYIVNVNAPPVIENVYRDKTFRPVKGDVALRIQCKATGNPTPTIVWTKNDLNIAAGSEWYDIDNGTLIIKNVDEKSKGSYLCLAKNKIGNDTMVYDVIVDDYPSPGVHVPTKYIEFGKPAHIKCDIPHMKTDSLRWYKDRRLIHKGELTIPRVQYSDEGIYSCRVSNGIKSQSAHVKIMPGFKPFFDSDAAEEVDFVQGDYVPLNCDASGEPEVTVSWQLNGKDIDVSDMTYELEMRHDNRGTYTCTISNELGSIQRSFRTVLKDCILDVKKDFVHERQPLMLSGRLTWPLFDISDGHMFIEKNKQFYLHCPRGFEMFPTFYLTAFCEGDNKIKVNGHVYKYSDIKCNDESEARIKTNGTNCLPGNTEYVQVGYKTISTFLNIYEVCLDRENNIPLYTKHQLSANSYGITEDNIEFSDQGLFDIDFESIYDCRVQAKELSTAYRTDGCCYDRRRLVNPKDLRPGIPIAAAYTYWNVVPHWSTCNSKNWADLEERVRDLAKTLNHDLTVITGTAKHRRRSPSGLSKDIVLTDTWGGSLPVATYLWKVIQDPLTSKSIAIIQVNVPNLAPEDVPAYVICKDICHKLEWMKGTNWRNVEDGYTYCCNILSFEVAFGFYKKFSEYKTGLLNYDVKEYTYSI